MLCFSNENLVTGIEIIIFLYDLREGIPKIGVSSYLYTSLTDKKYCIFGMFLIAEDKKI